MQSPSFKSVSLGFVGWLLFLTSCTTSRHPLPSGSLSSSSPIGFDANVRMFLSLEEGGDFKSRDFIKGLDLSGGEDEVFHLLQLSGGGEYGAFGAGLLNGWSESGLRPQFDMVTGVSTGALSAPLAFLGPDYDPSLKACYTEISAKDIFKVKGVLGLLSSPESAASSEPLKLLIAGVVDQEMVEKIAEEHNKGRRLYMATSYLDEQKFVVWDIGAIASSGRLDALNLIRKIMLASASIPLAFPPVMFDVENSDKFYDEMHVDGGVFASTVGIELLAGVSEGDMLCENREVSLITNWPIASAYSPVKRRAFEIGFHTFATMLKNAHRWDLMRTRMLAENAGFSFGYLSIPEDFPHKEGKPFDTEYMTQLYARGYQLGLNTDSWKR